jgi:hypothetical protein
VQIALSSEFEFDRIAAYLYQEKILHQEKLPLQPVAGWDSIRREFERRKNQPAGSYMPLYYSLRALSTAPDLKSLPDDVKRQLEEIRKFLLHTKPRPKDSKKEDDPLFKVIGQVRARLGGWRGDQSRRYRIGRR